MANLQEIKKILNEEGLDIPNLDNLNIEEKLSDQGLDSLLRADIFMTIEEHYNVELSDLPEENLDTFNSIIEYINQNKKS